MRYLEIDIIVEDSQRPLFSMRICGLSDDINPLERASLTVKKFSSSFTYAPGAVILVSLPETRPIICLPGTILSGNLLTVNLQKICPEMAVYGLRGKTLKIPDARIVRDELTYTQLTNIFL